MEVASIAPGAIAWTAISADFRRWLQEPWDVRVRSGSSGVEADIWMLGRGDESPRYVLKIWNRQFRADAERQHAFLARARKLGLPVPRTAGWGIDGDGHQVLAMGFAGWPGLGSGGQRLPRFAAVLARIHSIEPQTLNLPLESGLSYLQAGHFPAIANHLDVASLVEALLPKLPPAVSRLVHGDYNFSNAAFDRRGRMTILDWGEACIGDALYDAAWAAVTIVVYAGVRDYQTFMATYRAATDLAIAPAAQAVREAVAALRWTLISRVHRPIHRDLPGVEERAARIDAFVADRLAPPLRALWAGP